MTRWQIYLVLGLCIFGLGFVTCLGISQHRATAKAAAAQTQSDQHEGAAQAHAVQAAASDHQSIAQQAVVAHTGASVEAAKARLAALPPIPTAPSQEALAAANAVIAQQAQVITAQDQEIAALKLQDSIDRASADQWHKAFDESQQALALQKIAMDAAVHAERSSGVKAQLVRGLEGLALGYAGGRLTR